MILKVFACIALLTSARHPLLHNLTLVQDSNQTAELSRDLGKVAQGALVGFQHVIGRPFGGKGLSGVRASCSCASAQVLLRDISTDSSAPYELSSAVPDGFDLVLDVVVDTKGKSGPLDESLRLFSVDGTGSVPVSVTAEVIPLLSFSKKSFDLGMIVSGHSSEQVIDVRCNLTKLAKVELVHAANASEDWSISFEPTEQDKASGMASRWTLRVHHFGAAREIRKRAQPFILRCTGLAGEIPGSPPLPELPTDLKFLATATVVNEIYPDKEFLSFGLLHPGADKSLDLLVKSTVGDLDALDEGSIRLEGPAGVQSVVSWSVVRGNASEHKLRIRARVPSDRAPTRPEAIRGVLCIPVASGEYSHEIRVPLSGMIRK